ncbi:MAG: transposase [Patescibacteria group bacterium]
MNYRDYKQFAPNTIQHIFNRGTDKQNILIDDEDRSFFLWRLKEAVFPDLFPGKPSPGGYKKKNLPVRAFSILAYCLMPNHFHLLIRQNSEVPITKLLSKVCTSYSKYFNKKYDRVGGLFQDQYKTIRVENDAYLQWVSAYIHDNPVTAGFVSNARDYEWSSMPEYAGIRKGILCEKDFILNMLGGKSDKYEEFVVSSAPIIKSRKDIQKFLLD